MLVHGLWMIGIDMALLRHRLRQCGFRPIQFSYPTIRRNITLNAAALNRFVARINAEIDAQVIHFVGHSLGGLLIRQFLHDFPSQRPGRIVTLGTPHNGSLVAQHFNRSSLGRLVLGQSLDHALLGDMPPWDTSREIGVIAGTLNLGVGRLVPDLVKPNDGTVSVAETCLNGMTDHIAVHVSHTALLFSTQAAGQTCAFLANGHFDHQA